MYLYLYNRLFNFSMYYIKYQLFKFSYQTLFFNITLEINLYGQTLSDITPFISNSTDENFTFRYILMNNT